MINLPKEFTTYLSSQGLNKISIRNYLSDIKKFIAWFESSSGKKISPQNLKSYHISLYEKHLLNNSVSNANIKRYITSVKKFSQFLLPAYKTSDNSNPVNFSPVSPTSTNMSASPLDNFSRTVSPSFHSALKSSSGHPPSFEQLVQTVSQRYMGYLISQGLNKFSIKNYLADLEKFLVWYKVYLNSDFRPESLSGLDLNTLENYHFHLIQKGITYSTAKRYLASLKQFLKFVNPEVILPAPPKPYQKVSKDTKVSLFPSSPHHTPVSALVCFWSSLSFSPQHISVTVLSIFREEDFLLKKTRRKSFPILIKDQALFWLKI